jgi:hypothetical protein
MMKKKMEVKNLRVGMKKWWGCQVDPWKDLWKDLWKDVLKDLNGGEAVSTGTSDGRCRRARVSREIRRREW